MKNIFLSALIVVFFGSCQNRHSDIKSFQTDVIAIRTWLKNYTDAVKIADIDRILSCQSDDVCYWPANQPSFSGKENLRKWFSTYFDYCIPSEQLDLLDFQVHGDFAYLTGRYTVSAKIKQSGEEFRDNGKFVNFFKRDSNGNWICTQSIWNSDNRTFDLHSQILDDFSVSWKLDLSKSITLPGVISSNLVIVQKGNEVNIDLTNEIKDKVPEVKSFTFTVGSETQNILKSGIFIITSSFSSGRHTFTIKETLLSEKNGSIQEYKRITNYSLSAKGNILNIISDDFFPESSLIKQNERHTELVYNKL